MTTEEFIRKSKEVHCGKYDYSKVEYKSNKEKVCIICQEHGEFWQVPYYHLQGQGCPNCAGNKKMTTEEFIRKSKEVHCGKYDYSKVEYKNRTTKVCIICPEHGEFWQVPSSHLNGNGCPNCSGNKKKTSDEFIIEANKKHSRKYDYSKVEYKGTNTKVCIICPEHGEFWQTPKEHLKSKGCPCCAGNKKMTTEEFIVKAKEVHGDKYDYSKVEYKGNKEKVCIICPEHGEFWQVPSSHLSGCSCPNCGGTKKMTTEEFITKAKEVHGDKYDYSKVEYKNSTTKVCIICPEHGEFWQLPLHHLRGRGCSCCAGNKKMTTEEFITKSKEVHGDKYDYSKVKIDGVNNEVVIICPEHGEFWQVVGVHLKGHGCPICNRGYTKQYKFNLLEEFENEYAFRAFLENHDINILLSILMNIEPKYEPLKKDIEYALVHANEINPIRFLREKYGSDVEDSDDCGYPYDTDITSTDDFDWDNDDEVNNMILKESEKNYDIDTDDGLSIDDIIKNDEEEIGVISRLDREHLITPEVREYIKAKYKNDMMREWMAKRDNK